MLQQVSEAPTAGAGLADSRPTSSGSQQLTDDFDAFLQLMTAQMRNQDPLEPLDGSEFVAQLAQFSGVEQQIRTNEKLDGLAAALTRSDAEIAMGFLGRTVETASGRAELIPGEPVAFAFETDGPMPELRAVVSDDDGNELHSFELSADGPGRHEVIWDGLDADGNQVPAGTYTIEVRLYDPEGQEIVGATPALVRSKVIEARLGGDDGGFLILNNGTEAALSDLTAISA
jgi:flagellar basal-body rod modification protein FlgD